MRAAALHEVFDHPACKLQEAIDSFEFTGLLALVVMTMKARPLADDRTALMISADTIERGTKNRPFTLVRTLFYPSPPKDDGTARARGGFCDDPDTLRQLVLDEAIDFITHEVREGMFFEGVPLVDDHDPMTHAKRLRRMRATQ